MATRLSYVLPAARQLLIQTQRRLRPGGLAASIAAPDIKMPDMDGRELARRTVFITGDTVSPETRTFLQRVDNPCLAQPLR